MKELNDKMNCGCLESIIENDKNKHNRVYERFGIKTILESLYVSIRFETKMVYNLKKIDLKNNRTAIDRQEKDSCSIPFLFCPICGEKSKVNFKGYTFYENLQKK